MMRLWITILLLSVSMTCLYAEVVLLETFEAKPPRYSLGYRSSFSTAPSDLELGTFLDNRVTLYDEKESLYIFISKSASVSYNNVALSLSNDSDTYYESGFSRLQFGFGGEFSFDKSSKYKQSPWKSNLELMFTRYLGMDDNFDFIGIDFKAGLSYEARLSTHWSISPNLNLGFGTLYGARVGSESYSLNSSISGMVYDIGLTGKYTFQ